jgi:hypothetical protein
VQNNLGRAGIEDMLSEATRLGLGEPVAISAETGTLPAITPTAEDKLLPNSFMDWLKQNHNS